MENTDKKSPVMTAEEASAFLSKIMTDTINRIYKAYNQLAANERTSPMLVEALSSPAIKFDQPGDNKEVMLFCKEITEVNDLSAALMNRVELMFKRLQTETSMFDFEPVIKEMITACDAKAADMQKQMEDSIHVGSKVEGKVLGGRASSPPKKKGNPNSNLN